MRFSSLTLLAVAVTTGRADAQDDSCIEVPALRTLLHTAFPVWNVNDAGERIDGGGKWNPLYYTKKYDGQDPSLGGYPTDIDVGYPFYYAAPFFGQPGAGTPGSGLRGSRPAESHRDTGLCDRSEHSLETGGQERGDERLVALDGLRAQREELGIELGERSEVTRVAVELAGAHRRRISWDTKSTAWWSSPRPMDSSGR